jgi:hypothetical protein
MTTVEVLAECLHGLRRGFPHADRLSVDEAIAGTRAVWTALRRVLRSAVTAWLVVGDRHDGGSLTGLPWRNVFDLQRAG